MESNIEKFIPKVKFELIPIKDLTSTQNYQRNISMKHVERAAANFNPYQINPVKVSRRNGYNYVFNGQHTIEIVAMASGSRETPVWCMVYEELDYEQEADIFANQLKYTKALMPYEIFVANIEAGNDKELLINDIVNSYNLKISPTKVPGGICAVAALEYILDEFGCDILDRTLRVIIGTWEGINDSMSANMLKGVAIVLYAYGSLFNEEIFKEKLGRIPPKILIRNAKDRGNGAAGFSEAMVIEHNKKMKGGSLPIGKIDEAMRHKRKSRKERQQDMFELLNQIKAEE